MGRWYGGGGRQESGSQRSSWPGRDLGELGRGHSVPSDSALGLPSSTEERVREVEAEEVGAGATPQRRCLLLPPGRWRIPGLPGPRTTTSCPAVGKVPTVTVLHSAPASLPPVIVSSPLSIPAARSGDAAPPQPGVGGAGVDPEAWEGQLPEQPCGASVPVPSSPPPPPGGLSCVH